LHCGEVPFNPLEWDPFLILSVQKPNAPTILVHQTLKGLPRDKVQVATKFAITQVDGKTMIRGDAEYVRKACEDSLERLGVHYIDLYYQHRVDTKVPIEVTVLLISH